MNLKKEGIDARGNPVLGGEIVFGWVLGFAKETQRSRLYIGDGDRQ
jgi:hypothetical protein